MQIIPLLTVSQHDAADAASRYLHHDRTLTRRTLTQKTETELGGADLSTRRRVIKTTIALIKLEEAEAKAACGSHADDTPTARGNHFAVGVATGLGVPPDGVRVTGTHAGSVIAETSVAVDGGAETAAAFTSLLTDPAKPLVDVRLGPCAVSGVRVEEPAAAPAEAAQAEAADGDFSEEDDDNNEEFLTDAQLALALRAVHERHRYDITLTRWTLMQKIVPELGGVELWTRRRVIERIIALIKHEEAEAKAARGCRADDKPTAPGVDDGARDHFAVGVATGLSVPRDGVRVTGAHAGSVIVELSVTVDGGAGTEAAFPLRSLTRRNRWSTFALGRAPCPVCALRNLRRLPPGQRGRGRPRSRRRNLHQR